jgi:hypothetical protein
MWFDTYLHHRVRDADVAMLDPLDTDALARPVVIGKVLRCPKDGTGLRRFHDPQFPKDICIETCATCGGLWFNKGEFTAYRNFFASRWPKKIPHETSAQLLTRAFLELQQVHAKTERKERAVRTLSLESLKTLASFLLAKSHAPHSSAFFLLPLWAVVVTVLELSEDAEVRVDTELLKRLILEQQEHVDTGKEEV